MEHAYGEITACSESQELIITLCILLEYEETTCTTRIPKSYVWGGEIADSACPGEMWYYFYIRA